MMNYSIGEVANVLGMSTTVLKAYYKLSKSSENGEIYENHENGNGLLKPFVRYRKNKAVEWE